MRKYLYMAFTSILIICVIVEARENTTGVKPGDKDMKIRIIINNSEFTATMYDNPTARDFISLLPLTLNLEDYAGTEKVSKLPRRLSLEDAPSGSDPSVGDITYYSPWGNLAIFYREFDYAAGLIILGKIDNAVEFFDRCGDSCTVKISGLQ